MALELIPEEAHLGCRDAVLDIAGLLVLLDLARAQDVVEEGHPLISREGLPLVGGDGEDELVLRLPEDLEDRRSLARLAEDDLAPGLARLLLEDDGDFLVDEGEVRVGMVYAGSDSWTASVSKRDSLSDKDGFSYFMWMVLLE